MKNSIAKSILRLLLAIALAFTCVMVFYTVKTAREDAYEHSQMLAFQAAQSLSFSYSWDKKDIISTDKEKKRG